MDEEEPRPLSLPPILAFAEELGLPPGAVVHFIGQQPLAINAQKRTTRPFPHGFSIIRWWKGRTLHAVLFLDGISKKLGLRGLRP